MKKLTELFSQQDEISKNRQMNFLKFLNLNLKIKSNAVDQYSNNVSVPSIGILNINLENPYLNQRINTLPLNTIMLSD